MTPARLILNADDFGLTPGINRAIAELHTAGALTSATLMASGPAFDGALAIARAHPSLGIGCHIILTDGTPVSPPEILPTLCPNRLTFRPRLAHFLRDLLLGRIDPAEIEREALAQIQKLQHAGIGLTHIDTHKHTHILPRVARPLLAVAERCGIAAIRNPFEPSWSQALSPSTPSRRLQVRLIQHLRRRFLALPQIHSGRIQTTDGTLGISATGDLDSMSLRAILDTMPGGTWELVCHPGYNDASLDAITTRLRQTREIERDALLAAIPKFFSLPNAPQLINYRDV